MLGTLFNAKSFLSSCVEEIFNAFALSAPIKIPLTPG